ncbi:MAG: magnesium transporter CorA family protein [Candidatus Peribacteria bacterium]|nr:MAG: magnesium transporter CorA family protein [Candidatus Peribacteria bacterium]
MSKKLKIRGIKWIDGVDLDKAEVYKVLNKYDFHELDIDACLEENQTARIDVYEDYVFIILHFPRYNTNTKRYELNEFNIFLGRDVLITLRSFEVSRIDAIFQKYEKQDLEDNQNLKLTAGYILYEVIQAMLEKMFTVTYRIRTDIRGLESQVFDHATENLVKEIMIKKRNIVTLKHMFTPQTHVFTSMENSINTLYKGEMEVYFEDLEDKLGHIVNNIRVLEEYIESVEDAFKTIIDIKTNTTIKLLTIFSAFILPLTLITSFYGMNISLPYQSDSYLVYAMLTACMALMGLILIYFKKSGKL